MPDPSVPDPNMTDPTYYYMGHGTGLDGAGQRTGLDKGGTGQRRTTDAWATTCYYTGRDWTGLDKGRDWATTYYYMGRDSRCKGKGR